MECESLSDSRILRWSGVRTDIRHQLWGGVVVWRFHLLPSGLVENLIVAATGIEKLTEHLFTIWGDILIELLKWLQRFDPFLSILFAESFSVERFLVGLGGTLTDLIFECIVAALISIVFLVFHLTKGLNLLQFSFIRAFIEEILLVDDFVTIDALLDHWRRGADLALKTTPDLWICLPGFRVG